MLVGARHDSRELTNTVIINSFQTHSTFRKNSDQCILPGFLYSIDGCDIKLNCVSNDAIHIQDIHRRPFHSNFTWARWHPTIHNGQIQKFESNFVVVTQIDVSVRNYTGNVGVTQTRIVTCLQNRFFRNDIGILIIQYDNIQITDCLISSFQMCLVNPPYTLHQCADKENRKEDSDYQTQILPFVCSDSSCCYVRIGHLLHTLTPLSAAMVPSERRIIRSACSATLVSWVTSTIVIPNSWLMV